MSFFTRRGDDGTTGWLGKGRLSKHDVRIEVIGTIDEASAALGTARAMARDPRSAPLVVQAQRDLYSIMAEVATPPAKADTFRFGSGRVTWLEQQIQLLGQDIKMPDEFILPGDSPAEAAFAVARTVVRRAERGVVELAESGQIANATLQEYLNRLSSLLFVLELLENRTAGMSTTRARE
jgi:cob(I)alamin adenosyltransferase